MNRVTAFVGVYHDFYFTSHVFCGLWLLAERGEIELKLTPAAGRYSEYAMEPGMPLFRIEAEDGAVRTMCIALFDRSDRLPRQPLELCDVCFARDFYRPDLQSLEPRLSGRIEPLGMIFSCRRRGVHSAMLRSVLPRYLLHGLRRPRQWRRRWREDLATLRSYLKSPPLERFEQMPDEPLDPVVCFQTRVWGPDETTDDVESINGPRVRLVGALRQAFGQRFRGGVVPTEYAQQHYPDALTELSTRRGDYLAMAKRCLVGVYSRGLHQSLAFKLGEYLAGSMCIVSEPLRNELPRPLEEGRNCLFFKDVDECVGCCRRLLENPKLAAAMRQANHDYYREQVEPAALMRRCIERAMKHPRDSLLSNALAR